MKGGKRPPLLNRLAKGGGGLGAAATPRSYGDMMRQARDRARAAALARRQGADSTVNGWRMAGVLNPRDKAKAVLQAVTPERERAERKVSRRIKEAQGHIADDLRRAAEAGEQDAAELAAKEAAAQGKNRPPARQAGRYGDMKPNGRPG